MAISEIQLISKRGSSPPTTVSLDVGSVAANLSVIDRRRKKAGLPELRSLFESDDGTWLRTADVVKAFESARKYSTNAPADEFGLLFEAVAEQLGSAIDVLRALPKDCVIRLEIVKSKPRKLAKSKPARSESSVSGAASSLVTMKLPKQKASAVAEAMSDDESTTKVQL